MSKARNLSQVIVDVGGDINAASLDNVTPASISDKANTSTGAFDLPAGTTAQRPASPHPGQTRFNTTLGYVEWYDPTNQVWVPTSGSVFSAEYLVVAGGGGGAGAPAGAGAGAGGMLTGSFTASAGISFSVTVGAGGAGGTPYGNNSGQGNNSSVIGGLANLVSLGGGRGPAPWVPGQAGISGGSGSGGSGYDGTQGTTPTAGGAGTAGQGNAGGTGRGIGGNSGAGGGGGGAGAIGGNATTSAGGNGGSGSASSISGSSVTYAGGGGGSGYGVGNGSGGSGGEVPLGRPALQTLAAEVEQVLAHLAMVDLVVLAL